MENLHSFPIRIKDWLNARGITDEAICKFKLYWNGLHIVIPIFDASGKVIFNKYRRDPAIEDGPKYTYDAGSHTSLYGIESLANINDVIICEGEFDRIILEVQGFHAVTSTGGALSFKEEWGELFKGKNVSMIFDNDKAGLEGRMRVAEIVPHAKNVPLPSCVGEHGDVTDFFVKYKFTAKDLFDIINVSVPLPIIKKVVKKKPKPEFKKLFGTDIEKAKAVPIDHFLDFNSQGFAICPFHKEKTPSLKKYDDGKWWCYGGCGSGGDVIDFVRKKYGFTMRQALEFLLKKAS